MVDTFSVEYKTFICAAEKLKLLHQLDFDLGCVDVFHLFMTTFFEENIYPRFLTGVDHLELQP